jgi:hypothetical protein
MKVQILCPAGAITGGPEALHQLAHTARSLGADARMVYVDARDQAGHTEVPAPYRIYDVPVATAIDDSPGTLIVVSETDTRLLRKIRRARQALWWLSVDNYFADLAQRKKKRIRWLTGHRPLDLSTPDKALHLAQSAYAQDFLARHGRQNALMLTDYLRDDFIAQANRAVDASRRMGRVAFNPKKGIEVTQQLIAALGERVQFVPLQGMTPAQVIDTLQQCAVYIDFGHHPGRDRFPREAALCGACIVTGRRGSAAFEADVPVPGRYKFDEAAADFVQSAAACIESLAQDPARHAADFEPYRQRILQQKALFRDEVAAVLGAAEAMPR